jgi:hypothetical protein
MCHILIIAAVHYLASVRSLSAKKFTELKFKCQKGTTETEMEMSAGEHLLRPAAYRHNSDDGTSTLLKVLLLLSKTRSLTRFLLSIPILIIHVSTRTINYLSFFPAAAH